MKTQSIIATTLLLLALAAGCAYQSSKVYSPENGKLVAKARTYTVWDSQSQLAKLRLTTQMATNGEWSPGISMSGLEQSSTSTNINALVSAIVEGAVKGAAGAMK